MGDRIRRVVGHIVYSVQAEDRLVVPPNDSRQVCGRSDYCWSLESNRPMVRLVSSFVLWSVGVSSSGPGGESEEPGRVGTETAAPSNPDRIAGWRSR